MLSVLRYNTKTVARVLQASSVSGDVASDVFCANPRGELSVDIKANHKSGLQTLHGTFYLRHSNDPDITTMEAVSGYSFPAGPSGVLYKHKEPFRGALMAYYDILFVYISGVGDIEIWINQGTVG